MLDDLQDRKDKVLGSLALAGMGDALGAQTEQWTIEEIARAHGGLVSQFGEPPADTFAGANSGRRAEVTDDASQMYYLARALVAADGGWLDHDGWVRCLLDWAQTSPKAGFMGPSTAGVVKALQEGTDVGRIGAIGDSDRKMTTMGNTNGAAMRVAPCGLVHPGDIEAACEQAFVTCLPAHDTDVAISSCCAVAAACAKAVASSELREVVDALWKGAEIGEKLAVQRARRIAGPSFIARLEMAMEIAVRRHADDNAFLLQMERCVGNSVLAAESVPAALGILVYAQADPFRTISLCASAGNDTDSMATIAGAIAGALHGARRLPKDLYDEFLATNNAEYGLVELAHALSGVQPVRRDQR